MKEFKIFGSQMFDDMIHDIRTDTVRMLLTVAPRRTMERKKVLTAADNMNAGGGDKKVTVTAVKRKKVGPNDPCPCGSGLKYKKCCMAKDMKGNG